jgi:hypothetical protein
MTASLESDALRLQILSALEPTSDGQDLSVIHMLLNRSRRDTSMLPVMGALVSGGFLEKVSAANANSPNAPLNGSRQRRAGGPPQPVRFRLTEAGRILLQDARQSSRPAMPSLKPELDYANREANREDDRVEVGFDRDDDDR